MIATGGAAVMLSSPPPGAVPAPAPSRPGDVAAFMAVASRLQAGEPYYDAMGAELRAHSFPTTHVFNWRTPLLLKSIAASPALSRLTLMLAGVLLAFATMTTITQSSAAILAGVMQLGTVALLAVPASIYLSEVPAGVLMGLSVCAYARGMWAAGAGLAVMALFLRELAGPYCLMCAIVSVVKRRHGETWMWVAGAAGYAAFYAGHVSAVHAHQLASDLTRREPWLQFGGLRFLLAILEMHSWLIFLPSVAAAAALMLIVAAVLRPVAPIHLRAAAAIYAGFFLFVGQSFNTYWGYIAWPVWGLACGYGWEEILHCCRVVWPVSSSSRPTAPP